MASCGGRLIIYDLLETLVPSHDALIVNVNAAADCSATPCRNKHILTAAHWNHLSRGIRFQKLPTLVSLLCEVPWTGSKEPWLAAVRFRGPPWARTGGSPRGEQMVLPSTPDHSSKLVPGGDQSRASLGGP